MKVEEIKLAFETNVKFAGFNDVFLKVKESKAMVNSATGAINQANSRLGQAKNIYSEAKTLASKFLSDLKVLDPELVNSQQGKNAQRFLDTIDSDLKTVSSVSSDLSKLGGTTSKFVL